MRGHQFRIDLLVDWVEPLSLNGSLLQRSLTDLGLHLSDPLIEIGDQRKAVTILVGCLSPLSLQRDKTLRQGIKLGRPRPVRRHLDFPRCCSAQHRELRCAPGACRNLLIKGL